MWVSCRAKNQESSRGREIDAHRHVFRINGAVLRGYEQDVGRKSHVRVAWDRGVLDLRDRGPQRADQNRVLQPVVTEAATEAQIGQVC